MMLLCFTTTHVCGLCYLQEDDDPTNLFQQLPLSQLAFKVRRLQQAPSSPCTSTRTQHWELNLLLQQVALQLDLTAICTQHFSLEDFHSSVSAAWDMPHINEHSC